jgi:hypothetical protein
MLRSERVWVETFTGLRVEQFGRLLKAVRDRGGNGTLRGWPWSLPLAERVLIVAVYYRTNLTMRQLAPLFGISSSTVCGVIQRLGPLLALEPDSRPNDAADRLWIVDGTLLPVRDRHVGTSSRNYRFSANVQVIVDADTRLVIAAARPGRALRRRHPARRRRLPELRDGHPTPQAPPTGPAAGRGGRQRRAPHRPCPGGARDRPNEELQDPP